MKCIYPVVALLGYAIRVEVKGTTVVDCGRPRIKDASEGNIPGVREYADASRCHAMGARLVGRMRVAMYRCVASPSIDFKVMHGWLR